MTHWRGVRYRDDVGWEMRCDSCSAAKRGTAYWPITEEFWDRHHGLWRCRACWVAYARNRRLTAKVASERAAEIREYQRAYKARRREEQRIAEGRQRYERRKAA